MVHLLLYTKVLIRFYCTLTHDEFFVVTILLRVKMFQRDSTTRDIMQLCPPSVPHYFLKSYKRLLWFPKHHLVFYGMEVYVCSPCSLHIEKPFRLHMPIFTRKLKNKHYDRYWIYASNNDLNIYSLQGVRSLECSM